MVYIYPHTPGNVCHIGGARKRFGSQTIINAQKELAAVGSGPPTESHSVLWVTGSTFLSCDVSTPAWRAGVWAGPNLPAKLPLPCYCTGLIHKRVTNSMLNLLIAI